MTDVSDADHPPRVYVLLLNVENISPVSRRQVIIITDVFVASNAAIACNQLHTEQAATQASNRTQSTSSNET